MIVGGDGSSEGKPRYTRESLMAEMRAIDPERYELSVQVPLPNLVKEMLSWAAYIDYKGSLELSRRAYGNLNVKLPGGFNFEE